jgi:hypothetical protein
MFELGQPTFRPDFTDTQASGRKVKPEDCAKRAGGKISDQVNALLYENSPIIGRDERPEKLEKPEKKAPEIGKRLR